MSSIDLLQIFLGLETNFYNICFSWFYSLTKILRKDFFEIKFWPEVDCVGFDIVLEYFDLLLIVGGSGQTCVLGSGGR